MGVVSEISPASPRRQCSATSFMVYALLAIAMIGFLVWGHHMFVAGLIAATRASCSHSSPSSSRCRPRSRCSTGLRPFIGARSGSKRRCFTRMGFLGLFTIGGLTGLFLASVPVDIQATDTYFVARTFSLRSWSAARFPPSWPEFTSGGRRSQGDFYDEFWAQLAAITMFLGFNVTFLPQFVMGWQGMPRRYAVYPDVFQVWHVISTGGAAILAVAYVMPLIYLGWSILWGERAGDNPWNATGLEWQTTSPPPKENFRRIPHVTFEPYMYHAPGAPREPAQPTPVHTQADEP